jgi:hypothetical protein
MKTKTPLLLSAALLSALTAVSQPTVTFRVHYEITETQRGELYQYSERYLGTSDVIKENGKTYVLKDIVLTTPHSPQNQKETKTNSDKRRTSEIKITNNTPQAPMLCTPLNEETLTATNTTKKAESAARQIYRLREARTNIVSGESDHTPADGRAMDLSLKELKAMEAELTALFTGSSKTSAESAPVRYVLPDNLSGDSTLVLMRFSRHAGPVSADDLSGEPVYLRIQRELEPATEQPKKKNKKKKKDNEQPVMQVKATHIVLEYNGKQILKETLQPINTPL